MQEFACGSYEPIGFIKNDSKIICWDCATKKEKEKLDFIGMDSIWDFQPICKRCSTKLNVEIR